MGLTHGAISRQIRLLEVELDARLFVRGGRRVTLTATGRALVATTARSFAALRDGIAELQRRKGGPLVLSCEPTLTLAWLVPRLGSLRARHPEMVVHVATAGGPVDFERDGIDLAIRRNDFEMTKAVECEPLMDEWIGPVCSPAFQKTLRVKGARVPILGTRTRSDAFADWMRLTGRTLSVSRETSFDHFALSIQAAVAGLGLAMGPYPLVMDALAAGQLVAPFGFVRGPKGYVVLSPRTPGNADRIGALRTWLTGEAKTARPPMRVRDTPVDSRRKAH